MMVKAGLWIRIDFYPDPDQDTDLDLIQAKTEPLKTVKAIFQILKIKI
jgi:hypothetical protein